MLSYFEKSVAIPDIIIIFIIIVVVVDVVVLIIIIIIIILQLSFNWLILHGHYGLGFVLLVHSKKTLRITGGRFLSARSMPFLSSSSVKALKTTNVSNLQAFVKRYYSNVFLKFINCHCFSDQCVTVAEICVDWS